MHARSGADKAVAVVGAVAAFGVAATDENLARVFFLAFGVFHAVGIVRVADFFGAVNPVLPLDDFVYLLDDCFPVGLWLFPMFSASLNLCLSVRKWERKNGRRP